MSKPKPKHQKCMIGNKESRYAVVRDPCGGGYKWIDWDSEKVYSEQKLIPTEVVILLIKEFQDDTGLMAKIMQEEVHSKSLVNKLLDLIGQLVDVKNDRT